VLTSGKKNGSHRGGFSSVVLFLKIFRVEKSGEISEGEKRTKGEVGKSIDCPTNIAFRNRLILAWVEW